MAEQRQYRVLQIDGKITWQVEELWSGGTVRGPFGTKDAAIHAEEKYATENDFFNELVLREAVGQETKPEEAFTKDESGNWVCVQSCSIEMDNKAIVFTEGLSFARGTPYMGIDIAEWLDNNIKTE